MEKKTNQRVMLTKQLIHKAFLQLLCEKGIRDISIRELCDQAGVNRTTFYNHYGSQYDVFTEIAGQYLADIAAVIDSADVRNHPGVLAQVTLVLQYMAGHLELSKILLNNHVDESFASRLFSLPKIGDMLAEALSEVKDPEEKEAITAFAIHGSYRLLQNWVNDPHRRNAETASRLILELAGRVCARREQTVTTLKRERDSL